MSESEYMENKIVIDKKIQPGDLGSIVELHGKYYSKHFGYNITFEPYVALPLAKFILRASENEQIWIVRQNGIVRGSIAIAKKKAKTAQLRWFILDGSLQGKGIGNQLMRFSIDFAREKGFYKLILWTVRDLKSAIHLYEKNLFLLKKEVSHKIWGVELTEQLYELKLK